MAEPRRILCAHADRNGEAAHWLEPGERCHMFDADPAEGHDADQYEYGPR